MTGFEINSPMSPPGEVTKVVEHCFRHEAGKMVSTLTRIFGLEHLDRAEDVVQEALARALQTWPYYGIPKNPPAWITQVSKNFALDLIRREKIFRNKEIEIASLIEDGFTVATDESSALAENEIADDRLRMMFVCCHPLVSFANRANPRRISKDSHSIFDRVSFQENTEAICGDGQSIWRSLFLLRF